MADNRNMDFSDTSLLMANLVVGCIGAGLFMYGKKAQRMWPLMGGLSMCIYPWFIGNWMVLLGVTFAVMVFLFMMREK